MAMINGIVASAPYIDSGEYVFEDKTSNLYWVPNTFGGGSDTLTWSINHWVGNTDEAGLNPINTGPEANWDVGYDFRNIRIQLRSPLSGSFPMTCDVEVYRGFTVTSTIQFTFTAPAESVSETEDLEFDNDDIFFIGFNWSDVSTVNWRVEEISFEVFQE